MIDERSTHLVVFQPAGRQGRVAAGTTVLDAARQLGVDVDSICGGRQTCGRCRIRVESGAFAKHAIDSAPGHLTEAAAAEQSCLATRFGETPAQARLSCAAAIVGDIVVTVPIESQTRKPIARKSAADRLIELEPTLREVFVEVAPHRLGERDGNWERLQTALRDEWRLGLSPPGLRIDLPALARLTPALRDGKQRVTVVVWNDEEVIDVRPGYQEGLYGLAVDLGSTTVAAHLCDLRSGAILATEAIMNPQVAYGEDLMSRVSYAMMHDDGLERMRAAIIGGLDRVAGMAARTAGLGPDAIHEMVVVGNTVMHHILLGLDPTELGAAPFTLTTHAAIDVRARELGLALHPGARVHLMALEAGHVGSDNVAVLIAEAPETRDDLTLVIDVGTNAEIVLGNRELLQSASSPTGPAFEGAQITHGQRAAAGAIERVRIDRATGEARFQVIGRTEWSNDVPAGTLAATGICGSGIIDAVAELFTAGVLRHDGRFDPEASTSRLRWNGRKAEYVLAAADETATGREIVITQDDVRNILLAKAALYAGCKLLMRRRGVTAVDRIVLTGAFGNYLDPLRAMILGLYPDCDVERVQAVGNAAGDGARIALLSKTRRAEAARIARRVQYIETAIDPSFQEEFVGALHLPHMSDAFPHLEARGALPARLAASGHARTERQRRREARADHADRTGR